MNAPGIGAASEVVVALTCKWIERAVIGLNLCPYAKAVYVKGQVRCVVSKANTTDALLEDLHRELRDLSSSDPLTLDTTLLIHPEVLTDFLDYNEFLGSADAAIRECGLDGVLQIASFHPAYQFAGTTEDDIANFTNRSPFPMLQILRESSVSRAVAAFPDPHSIYQRNIETMLRLGISGWEALGLDTPDAQ